MEALLDTIPDAARDLKLNMAAVLGDNTLSESQRLGVALACSYAVRHERLTSALLTAAKNVEPSVVDDAKAAAALMAMTNVFYRFRHLVGKEVYGQKPARLRMNRIAKPAGNKVDFELFCLAVSAINGCEVCITSHERAVLEGGLTEDQVHDAIRIAASVHGTAVALSL